MKTIAVLGFLFLGACGAGPETGGVGRPLATMPGAELPDGAACLPSGDLCTDSAYCCPGLMCYAIDDAGDGECGAP